ncbi:PadR family transcriptional regulator [Liquorilactobacillus satsumensis]|uniref:Transcriptional regulator n=2 Tax=Liquorilactobacillus satsumensis TaxID=259059 RepID=A0A0R1V643_9LACO|nr:PadR family transcriptional regulator [Liquorilactobacillus satsumensis]KRL97195.1 transcriptional regulator [Liquorilactobacillus satsumensis DSM 16230 = JCM 12392]MCC7666845.1 PadR family transcriptional regulator [Liquorilactobacillus satsumensis]MCP9328618.1 PadR family transcriptional regulator [Liquorilactobacillus satsumensis]MCP9356945.1 PadR family transcriptional regulator [Liquorilactobacillus satsumensis]MCP9370892.1 PadR family transcriptional regulator [Liquorilactobacillus sa
MAKDNDTQMLKGILQGCMLFLLAENELYGYAIGEALSKYGFDEIPKGTIYPLLMTMEKKGLLNSRMKSSPDGPNRKYYSLTAAGVVAKQTFANQWHVLSQSVERLIQEENNES